VPSPSLRELQRRFWHAFADAPGARDDPADDPHLLAAIVGDALPAGDRLQIYRDMYFSRIRAALHDDYPRVAAELGDARFQALVGAYLARHPSQHPSLRHIGARLPGFIRGCGADLPPHLADLARLEWARVEVFDAPDATPLTPADLRALPTEEWPALVLAPIPGCEVVRATWPVHRAWAGEPMGGPAPTALRVWRQGFGVYHAPMEADEDAAFERLRAGAAFADVCEVFASLPAGEAARAAGALLARWLDDALLIRLPAAAD
jgi:hypothetical protein